MARELPVSDAPSWGSAIPGGNGSWDPLLEERRSPNPQSNRFADSAGRFCVIDHDWDDRSGLRNPQWEYIMNEYHRRLP